MRALLLLLLLAMPARAAELHVFAAASLSHALEEIAPRFEKTTRNKLVLNLGASSTLARQIQEGAPADLFLSADEEKMDALEKRKLLLPFTRRSVLSNALVVVVPSDSGLKIAGPGGLAAVRALALAEPKTVPAGIYARKYLEKKGLWPQLSDRVIPTENVRAALAAVESGNADAGIVYKTDARISRKVKIVYEVPRAEAPEISYPFVVLAGSRREAAARQLLDFLSSPAGLAVFRKHGFLILD